jgi:hypothetical protein
MDSIASVAGVGAVASRAEIQVEHQTRALKLQKTVVIDLGANALKLIQAAVVNTPEFTHDLDVRA